MIENSVNLVAERLAYMEKTAQKIERAKEVSKPKIQRVPTFLRQNDEFVKSCTPRMISFGPIHHGKENLKQGEDYKLLWTSMYLEEYRSQTTYGNKQGAANFLHEKIETNIGELKKLFTEDAIGSHDDEDLAWMLFVDGCSLLHFMEKVDDRYPGRLKLKFDELVCMSKDIVLLENQIPWEVLKLLRKTGFKLEELTYNFLDNVGEAKNISFDVHDGWLVSFVNWISKAVFRRTVGVGSTGHPPLDDDDDVIVEVPQDEDEPTHILDYIHRTVVSKSGDDQESGKKLKNQQDNDQKEAPPETESHKLMIWQTYKNIRDLKAAGIRVTTYEKGRTGWVYNVSFESKWMSGELRLSRYVYNDRMFSLLRNMVAYELCLDFQNSYEFCSFIAFVVSLIDSAEDVKELRSAGVLQNLLGSDEELAKAFNELGNDLPIKIFNSYSTDVVAFSKKHIQVKQEIERHYRNKWKTWLAEFWNTHFKTPWTMLTFLAAVMALVLAFIQAWYSVPRNKA